MFIFQARVRRPQLGGLPDGAAQVRRELRRLLRRLVPRPGQWQQQHFPREIPRGGGRHRRVLAF